MKFRNKILLAIWGVVLVLLLITSFTIKYWMEVQVEARFKDDLRSNYALLRELNSLRAGEISKSSEIVAETPRLKAVVELGDRNTALQLSQDLNRSIVSDLFLIHLAHRRPLVQLVDGKSVGIPLIDSASRLLPDPQHSSVEVMRIENAVYWCATSPIIIGSDLIGALTLGFRIEHADLQSIKTMTNSDVVLSLGNSIQGSTMETRSQDAVAQWLHDGSNAAQNWMLDSSASDQGRILTLQTRQEKYLATVVPLNQKKAAAGAGLSLLLLKPVGREVSASLKPVYTTFIIISLIVLVVTAGIGYVISQGITRPIAALVRGTTEISRGNYDYPIEVGRDAELRYLAENFTEMSKALKEKMHELAERNTKLEEALKQLRETQEELVKSERLAATGKLTAQLSHEINNPVHNIQSCLQTILKRLNASPSAVQEKELLDVALEEVDRLAKLTRQMLDVYRTSMVPLEQEPVQMNEIIRDVLASSAQTLRSQEIDVKLLLSPALPAIEGSKDKLKQVFLNLFLNAKDAMPKGGTLSVETAKQNGNVSVTVADTGVGIPPENINRIFDAFYTTKSKVSGVGLGLSVTYGIVRQHGGTITVKSKVGQGAAFHLVFPTKQL